MSSKESVVNDPNASIAERTDALMAELGLDDDGDGGEEKSIEAIGAAAKAAIENSIIDGGAVQTPDVVKEASSQIIPNLYELFPDSEIIATQLSRDLGVDGKIVGVEPERVKLRKPWDPDTIYDPQLNPKLINLVVMFLYKPKDQVSVGGGMMSEGVFQDLIKLAMGRNIPIVSFIRQVLHFLLRSRGLIVEGWIPNERKSFHEPDNSLENQRLELLLGLDVYEELQNKARMYNASPVTAMNLFLLAGMQAAII